MGGSRSGLRAGVVWVVGVVLGVGDAGVAWVVVVAGGGVLACVVLSLVVVLVELPQPASRAIVSSPSSPARRVVAVGVVGLCVGVWLPIGADE